ncbi:MAG: divergent polysaccharide deacetylase family protein [Deltaproteobacteria bacterium]|nr:divergent polysaccharide deacetylase family protein [Deltaproteobacteria bacterium]
MLIGGAFIAGLLAVGVVLFLPESGNRVQGPASSSFAPPPPPPQAPPQPLPQAPQARIAIVVDDMGYEPSLDAEWLKLPGKLNVAVLPFGPSSRKVAESARARGWGVILHVPMEPENPASDKTERFRIRRGMTGAEIESLLSRMAENLPQATGVSNHMGSAATSDRATMSAFVSAIRKRGYFLLDSVTTPASVALDAAGNAGVPAARRDVFLDSSLSPEDMRSRWEQAVSLAKEKGTAVLICHAKAETLRVIAALLPRLREANVQAVTLDELLRPGKET